MVDNLMMSPPFGKEWHDMKKANRQNHQPLASPASPDSPVGTRGFFSVFNHGKGSSGSRQPGEVAASLLTWFM